MFRSLIQPPFFAPSPPPPPAPVVPPPPNIRRGGGGELVRSGALVEQPQLKNVTPLMLAAENGHVPAIQRPGPDSQHLSGELVTPHEGLWDVLKSQG